MLKLRNDNLIDSTKPPIVLEWATEAVLNSIKFSLIPKKAKMSEIEMESNFDLLRNGGRDRDRENEKN